MTTSKGYYCIIHYCPNRLSMECVMVGVILLSEEHHWMGASMVKDNRRAITLFNMTERESSYLELYKESVAHRINAADDSDRSFNWLNEYAATRANDLVISHLFPWELTQTEQYAATRANDLVITLPRMTKVEDPETSMAVLFDQLTRHERT